MFTRENDSSTKTLLIKRPPIYYMCHWLTLSGNLSLHCEECANQFNGTNKISKHMLNLPMRTNWCKDSENTHLDMTELTAQHPMFSLRQAPPPASPLGLLPKRDPHNNKWNFAGAALTLAETRPGGPRILLHRVCNLRICSWETKNPIPPAKFLMRVQTSGALWNSLPCWKHSISALSNRVAPGHLRLLKCDRCGWGTAFLIVFNLTWSSLHFSSHLWLMAMSWTAQVQTLTYLETSGPLTVDLSWWWAAICLAVLNAELCGQLTKSKASWCRP